MVSLVEIALRLLILPKHLFHGEEFGALSHIDVENKGIDADHLLVKPESLASDSYRRILKPTNNILKEFHVHVAGHKIFFSQLGEDLHYLDTTEG